MFVFAAPCEKARSQCSGKAPSAARQGGCDGATYTGQHVHRPAPALPGLAARPVVLGLIPFHAARIFTVGEPFYVKNRDLSAGLGLLVRAFEL